MSNKITSAFIDITILEEDSKMGLYGICDLSFVENLSNEEIANFKLFLLNNLSDGYGSSFEQRDIHIDNKTINVHFWNEFNFYIETIDFFNSNIIDCYPNNDL